ncbi:hypothetical protein [Rhodopseudomonas sp.]|uniref:hypothetical protein n=1 Tax=Rhodopseudomonas sp. TaxID=1078 RepID=UPI0025F3BAB8|nr:hypothetical protein [Rhodopseudomonas sp.]
MAAILETRHATDIVRRKSGSHLNSKIPGGHELEFEFLAEGAIGSTGLAESPGGLALEFALAEVADIGADHESEQMLRIDVFTAHIDRNQREQARNCRPEGS